MNQLFLTIAKKAGVAVVCAATVISVYAKENKGRQDVPQPPRNNTGELGKTAGCLPATQQRDLDINNVRTTILNGGDMWWNLSNARYEIPKIQTGQVSKHSLYAGALWIGGVKDNNLKLAAQTYRQSGNDFYPGPLANGTVTADVCKRYDKIYRVTLLEIEAFAKSDDKVSNVPTDIEEWPGSSKPGDPVGIAPNLAPYFDKDGNGRYNSDGGDYPTLNDGVEDLGNIPDMMLFMIYNDKGNLHSETSSNPIGLEFHLQAFAYSTNNEINNMTFYRTTIFNRSLENLDSTIFGQWVDADLGNFSDDYVECDVKRNLGICYNGDDNDEGILGYGMNPPSVGVVFFEGPRRPDGSEIGMSKFVYYNNDGGLTGNPFTPAHYWNYLNGRWKDGASITYGGSGRGGTDTASYMFPGNSDPAKRAAWTERTAGNQPQDRRFLQTAGPFSMVSGAVNRVTIGVVWARASSGGSAGSLNILREASDKATLLYRNNFNQKVGPPAPKIEIVELGKKLVFKMSGTKEIEQFTDSFAGPCGKKTIYQFQGYQVFQLKTPNIPNDLNDPAQARLVAQFDIADGVGRVVNTLFSAELEENVKRIMVDGNNSGIQHTFEITKDYFETGTDQTLVNFKDYYYYAVAYATSANCPSDLDQYLPSAKTLGSGELLRYTATPHNPVPSTFTPQADYGAGIPLTMLEGIGNGGRVIRLSQASVNDLLSPPYYAKERKYLGGYSPVQVKIIDPLKVPRADFELGIRDYSVQYSALIRRDSLAKDSTRWYIKNLTTGEVIFSDTTIAYSNEQVFEEWGLSVQILQSIMPGDAESLVDESNGYITSEIVFSGTDQWLTGVADEEIPNYVPYNWIRSGSTGKPDYNSGELHDFAKRLNPDNDDSPKVPLDPRRNLSNMIQSTWAPYALAARWRTANPTKIPTFGPAWDTDHAAGLASLDNNLSDLHSVEVVLTRDKSKWSRCIVFEMGEDKNLNIGGADKFDMRRSPSVDKNGEPDGTGNGMGWFPGYAIDLETGERLNILFGEDSSIPDENGNDMIWNPTSTIFRGSRPVFGGKHYIYVARSKQLTPEMYGYKGPRYDECADYYNRITGGSLPDGTTPSLFVRKRQVFSQMIYTSMALLKPGSKMFTPWNNLVPSDVTIRIHMKRPFACFSADGVTLNDSMPLFRFSTEGMQTIVNERGIAKRALDQVSVVPNPYYAYSQYEDPGNQLDSRIKITNLPPKCLVQIYTKDGVVVRTIRKDDPNHTYIIWDLKNNAKAPIASGVYLIHIKSEELGEERIIKWFGIMRPVDYDTF
jgi:hypothetical protein